MKYFSLLIGCLFLISVQAQDTLRYNFHYSTFLGGGQFEQARDIAVDSDGNIYVTGGTTSADFPVTEGSFTTIFNDAGSSTVGNAGPMMVFVCKFSPNGEMIWSTFIGGPNYDRAYAIEVDALGNVYIGGRAGDNFPTTPGAFQENFIQGGAINNLYGHQNGFISKLSSDGTELIWSTYYGSDSFGFFRDIAIDDQGAVYGILNAVRTLPNGISPDAFDTDLNGSYDMVPVKFSADGSTVLWATVLGGSGEDRGGPSIRVGPDKSVYVAGGTFSTDWPVTPGAFQTEAGGSSDIFLTRLSPNGDSLIFSTYYGGSGNEFSETHCLEVDYLGQAYLAGGTNSTDLPVTDGVIKPTKSSDDGFDALLARFSATGSLLASTYFGASSGEAAEGLYIDSLGVLSVGGATQSTDFPTTTGALQAQHAGGSDGFVIQLSPNFDSLLYSTFWGGEEDDAVRAFHLSQEGVIVCSGQTESANFPVTADAFQFMHASPNASADSYLSVFTPEEELVVSGVTPVQDNESIIVFPNPFGSQLTVSTMDSTAEARTIRIYDCYGRLIYQQALVYGRNSLPSWNWPAGLYWYEVSTAQAVHKKGRLIKVSP